MATGWWVEDFLDASLGWNSGQVAASEYLEGKIPACDDEDFDGDDIVGLVEALNTGDGSQWTEMKNVKIV